MAFSRSAIEKCNGSDSAELAGCQHCVPVLTAPAFQPATLLFLHIFRPRSEAQWRRSLHVEPRYCSSRESSTQKTTGFSFPAHCLNDMTSNSR